MANNNCYIDVKSTVKRCFIDLFAGCGGLSLGLHKAGWEGIFVIEKSPDAFLTLQHNLIIKNNHFNWPHWLEQTNHDINYIIKKYSKNLRSLRGSVTLVAGGPPCQGFSMAGRRCEGDERNKLIDSYIEFVRLVEPKILFFENVKGFTIGFKKENDVHNRDKAYSQYVWEKLEALGYNVHGDILDFSQFGVPQRRQRFILVGTKIGSAEYFFKRIVENKGAFLKTKGIKTDTVSLEDAISDLLQKHGQTTSPDSPNFYAGKYSKPQNNYQKLMRTKAHKVGQVADSHRFANHTKEISERFKFILDNLKRNKNISDLHREKFRLKKHTIVPLSRSMQTPTLTTLPDDYIHYCEPRILTVREYARIQTFPDEYEFIGKYTTGGNRRKIDVPRYSQIGNAIPPLFAEQAGLILRQMVDI